MFEKITEETMEDIMNVYCIVLNIVKSSSIAEYLSTKPIGCSYQYYAGLNFSNIISSHET